MWRFPRSRNDRHDIEKFLVSPQIQIQVLSDAHGNTACLGERDCTMQRRPQKIIEEAPASHFSREVVAAVGA
jgi:3-methylcrotonyl-CoA carboxylase alpha subunit